MSKVSLELQNVTPFLKTFFYVDCVFKVKQLAAFRLDYEYEMEYENDF